MDHRPMPLPAYARLGLPDPPAHRPYVLVNMVMSVDGKIVIEGSEAGLGSPADQALMRALRTNVDAVLNGAQTLRASGSSPEVGDPGLVAIRTARGLPAAPLGVVLTQSGDLPIDAEFFTSRSFEALVVATDETSSDQLERLQAAGRPVEVVPAAEAATTMLRILRERHDVRSLLCEGGATLNGLLFDAGLVDECFITLAPRIVGGDVALTPVRAERPGAFAETWPLSLISAIPNTETGEVYLRYRVASRRGIEPR